MTLGAYFAIIVGLGMIGFWIYSLVKQEVPELYSEPVTMAFHLLAELVTGITLIIGGIVLLMGLRWGLAVYLLAAGALLYSVTNSAGYFIQRRKWPMAVVFAIILILALISVLAVFGAIG